MVKNIAKRCGLLVFVVAWGPFLGCDTLLLINLSPDGDQIDDVTDGTDNVTDGTDGVTDGTDDGAPDGTSSTLAVFVDPDTTFSTSDVRDVDEEIVQFDPTAKTLIWVADGTAFGEGSWEVNDVFLGFGGGFQVRFGTKNGERRAYFTETGPATICDISVQGGELLISPTGTLVPQE